MTKKNCEHNIGLLQIYEGGWLITVEELKREQPNTGYLMKEYLDSRYSTNLYKFKYCPCCGEKLDWKQIRKDLLEE